jgi:sulfur carrier protein ThiS
MTAAAAILCGCAARQPALKPWRVATTERGVVVEPPRAWQGETLRIGNARATRGGRACVVETAQASVRFRGRAAEASVRRSALTAPDVMLEGGGPRRGQALLDLSWFNELRLGLVRLEDRKCLRPGEGGALAGRLLENLPAPGHVLYQLRYGDYARSGWLDLEPQFLLRAVAPVRDAAGQVKGFETAFYDLPARKEGGMVVRFASAEAQTKEGKETLKAPGQAKVEVPVGAGFLRMFFRSWTISRDRRIALLAAARREELEKGTEEFERDPEAFCAKPGRIFCLAVPKDTVIGAELKIRTNGQTVSVPVGGTVADLVRATGLRDPAGVLPTLKLTRPYEGKPLAVEFDRARTEVLRVVLLGGEEVSW